MVLDFIYYSLYKFVRITPSKDEHPHHIANMSFSLLISFNLFFLIGFLDKKEIINYGFSDLKESYLFICIGILILVHLLFVYKQRYKVIVKKYDSHSFRRRLFYHIITFVWFIVTVVLAINKA